MLSIMPKIPEISVGIHIERSVSGFSDRNIRDQLWRWSTYFGWNMPMSFHFRRVFALISDQSVWHNGEHPREIHKIPKFGFKAGVHMNLSEILGSLKRD